MSRLWKKVAIGALFVIFNHSNANAVIINFTGEAQGGGTFGTGLGLSFSLSSGDPVSGFFDYIATQNSQGTFVLNAGGLTFRSDANLAFVQSDNGAPGGTTDRLRFGKGNSGTTPHVTVDGSLPTGVTSSFMFLDFTDFTGTAIDSFQRPDPLDLSAWDAISGQMNISDGNNNGLFVQFTNLEHVSAPEPGTLALFGMGLAGLGLTAWRRRKAN